MNVEEYVIGAILQEGSIAGDVALLPEHFGNPILRKVYSAIKETTRKNIHVDIVSVARELGNDWLRDHEGVDLLTKMTEAVPTTAQIEYYADMVLEDWKKRKAREICSTFQMASDGDISALISALSKVDEQGTQMEVDPLEAVSNLLIKIKEGEGLKGVDTGYPLLNTLTNGLADSEMIVVGARPSVGKTAFALNLARNAADKGKAIVAFFSLEMARDPVYMRLLSMEARITSMKFRSGKISEREWEDIYTVSDHVAKRELFIYDDPNLTIEKMRAILRGLKRKYPDRKIVGIVDYLQYMRSESSKENRNQEISAYSRGFKNIARDLHIPMVILSQLARTADGDRRPLLSELRDSGSIEQDADVVMLLWREDYQQDDPNNRESNVEVNVAKNRNGMTGIAKFRFIKDYGLFYPVIDRR